MPYTPNNPLVPGDPYSYDLRWIVDKIKGHDSELVSIHDDITDIQQFIADLQAAQISGDPWNLKGKKLLFFGDSITYGYNGDGNNGQVAYPYPKTIGTITGAVVYNRGISGATMARKAGNVNDLKSQLTNAVSIIPNADYIFIAFGINDYIQAVPIGPEGSDNWEHFNGAMYNAVDYIRNFNSTAQIIFLSPWPNQYYYNHVNNSWGCNIRGYENAIRDFCAKRSIKYIQTPNHSGISEDNWQALTADNTHYTQAGYVLAALTVLNSLGGNDAVTPYMAEALNIFEPLAIPNYTELNQYFAVASGTTSTQNSYNPYTFNQGLYRIEYDAYLDSTDYSAADGYVGCHLFIGSTSLISMIGFAPDAAWHHYVGYKYLTTQLTGSMAVRPANSAGATITDMLIKNIKIYPLQGQKVEHSDVVELTPVDGTGSVQILRKDGRISIYADITPTSNIAANTALVAQSNAFQKIANAGVNHYFPIMKDATTITRAGISSSNTFNVTSSLTTSNRILGGFTY